MNPINIDVVIPCYRVRQQLAAVVRACLAQPFVRKVIVVDDACPDDSASAIETDLLSLDRIWIIRHAANQGVGGAMLSGYRHAFHHDADIVVKVDGDGQMPPERIAKLIAPLLRKQADYTKGNRFYSPKHLSGMPKMRLFGNAMLSLVNKISSGYWSIIDPTNGFTALSRAAWLQLDGDTLERRYFFESDMLYQLGIANAVVRDVAMPAVYNGEPSSLNITRVALEFPPKYLKRFVKRIGFRYFLREFNIASLEILLGVPLLLIGLGFGIFEWTEHVQRGELTPAGTSMIVGLLILMGFQMILSAINYDVVHEPQNPLSQQDDAVL
jgi:glycosyltransferase involved in cell wall biosynthesis